VDKADGRNGQNILVLPIVAHSFTHTLPTDAEGKYNNNFFIF
jgi:hypothetical protein